MQIREYSPDYNLTFFVVSDPHLTYPVESENRLSEDSISIFADTLEYIEKESADIVFFTGDILESRLYGLVNLEIAFRIMNKLTIPWFVLVGNHDLRYRSTLDAYDKACFIEKFRKHGPFGNIGYWRYNFPGKKISFIGLDTSMPGSGHGIIGREQKEWLEHCLSEIDRDSNIIILVHHPFVLFDNEIRDVEEMNIYLLTNHDKIKRIIERYENIILVISGHNHTCRYLCMNGIHYVGCPSINTWPTMFTKFVINKRSITFNNLPIRDNDKRDRARQKLFDDKSSLLKSLGSKEAVYNYFGRVLTNTMVELNQKGTFASEFPHNRYTKIV